MKKEKVLAILMTEMCIRDRTAFTRAGGIEQVAAVITDEKPSDRWLELFRRKGVECYYPKS